ncbi:MAG: type III-B CRISPR module-associated protein Cmr5 [Candidatus Dadabacteria bacterium]|nr:type III-B CRISPR module-associated protein Cmr5 [Candidatus Dadabacteria bacterium]
MSEKTIEQRRAANALERVQQLNRKPENFKKLYRAYVDRLGPAIVMNGLGQALAATWAAASQNPENERQNAHHELYQSMQGWLTDRKGGVYHEGTDILQAITNNDESQYLRAHAESIAWLKWHKKLCRALFPKGEEDSEK